MPHIKLSETRKFELFESLTGYAYDSDLKSGGISYLEAVNDEHKLSTCHTSDMFYFVIEDSAIFQVGGKKYSVSDKDLVIIPKNTEYGYKGTFKYVLFMSPPFSEGCETRTNISIDD
jgi:mannose-6-phosphate isomerase-like protein (cupin superfamily)